MNFFYQEIDDYIAMCEWILSQIEEEMARRNA